jgi:hypothetical protein
MKIFRKKTEDVGIAKNDLFKARIVTDPRCLSVNAGTTIILPVTVGNSSEGTWPANSQNAVRFSYHLFNEKGEKVVWME